MEEFNLIINKPEALRKRYKYTDLSLTLVFWIVFFYLWQPLISLVAWGFGFKIFYEHMTILGGASGFFELLFYYIVTVVFLGGALISWALYNKFRFRNSIRRSGATTLCTNEVADFFKISPVDLKKLQKTKNLTIDISEEFEISVDYSK